MAWRCSGANNTKMVDKLKGFDIITSNHVEAGFREVDRRHFVPERFESMAHSDQPLKEGNVHISSPHLYGRALNALDLVPNTSISFLNIGSGTGYLSCIVAAILGKKSLNYGVELNNDAIEHCKVSISKWKANTVEVNENTGISAFKFMDNTADIHIIKGNGLRILQSKGESAHGYDRIYVGAEIKNDDLVNIAKLLRPGGILVGPVDDELVKAVRIRTFSKEMDTGLIETEDDDSTLPDLVDNFGLNQDFESQVLTGVTFAPLVRSSTKDTVIPTNLWKPSSQRSFPSEFQRISMQLMMCSKSQLVQPLPPVPSPEERFNAAAMLPKAIWTEILSYSHRSWFEPEQSETDYLKQRLREEKTKLAKSERARREAVERCVVAERERAIYRWQSRLNNVLVSQQDQLAVIARHREGASEVLSDILDLVGSAEENGNLVVRFDDRQTLSGLRAMLQQLTELDDDTNGVDEDHDSFGEEGMGNEEPPDEDSDDADDHNSGRDDSSESSEDVHGSDYDSSGSEADSDEDVSDMDENGN